jgi:hypothetical protein
MTRTNDSYGPTFGGAGASSAAALPYVPAVPTDWAPPPTDVAGALDEIVRNGAGHFQKARDPLLTPAPTLYVDGATGSDSTGTGTALLPFATVARAFQALPAMGEYGGTTPYIAVAAGTYAWPAHIAVGPDVGIDGTLPATQNFVIDAAGVAINTVDTGTRIYTTSLALAATIRIGSHVYIAASTTPGGALAGMVYKADNSGAGGKLVLWVAADIAYPSIVNMAAGTSIEVRDPYGTIFDVPDYASVGGGIYITSVQFGVAGQRNLAYINGVTFTGCTINTTTFITGQGAYFDKCDFTEEMSTDPGTQITLETCVAVTPSGGAATEFLQGSNSVIGLQYENAFVGATGTILRSYAGVVYALTGLIRVTGGVNLVANVNPISVSVGGDLDLPPILEPKTLAGAVVAGSYTGSFLVDVGPLTGAQVRLDANTSVTIGAVLNPVAINSAAASADASGTRIVGGYPKPGAAGPSLQIVTASAQTWDGVSRTVVLDSSAIGAAGTFLLPATASITDGAGPLIINEDGTNSVDITKTGGDTINLGAGPIATGATQAAIQFTNRRSATNWMIS